LQETPSTIELKNGSGSWMTSFGAIALLMIAFGGMVYKKTMKEKIGEGLVEDHYTRLINSELYA